MPPTFTEYMPTSLRESFSKYISEGVSSVTLEKSLAEYVSKYIAEGVSSAAPETVQIVYKILVNVELATLEVYKNLYDARQTLQSGREDTYVIINSLITGSGVVTAGWSAIRLSVTRDPIAKGCYCASIVFSSGAVASGSMAVISRMCKISEVAILSEIVGGAFLCLGEMAQAQALKAEGKPIPARLQKWAKPRIPFRQSAYSNQNLGFIMPGGMSHTGLSDIIEHIPFEKIGKVVGISLTAYGYYKIVIISYHYGQKIIRKLKEYRQNKLIEYRSTSLHRRIHFLAISLCNRPSFRRTLLIYEFAIS